MSRRALSRILCCVVLRFLAPTRCGECVRRDATRRWRCSAVANAPRVAGGPRFREIDGIFKGYLCSDSRLFMFVFVPKFKLSLYL